MIIATWNVFSGLTEERTGQLNSAFNADIIAFQETDSSEPNENSAWVGDAGKTRKGVSVWSKHPFNICTPNKKTSPSLGIAIDDSPLGDINILNLWGKPTPTYYEDLMRSLTAYDEFIKSRPTIILGDFNISPRLKGKQAQFNKLNSYFESELDMRSAYHHFKRETFGMETRTTLYFKWGHDGCYYCDYIYVPRSLCSRIKSVSVPGFKAFESSDHRPVICEFD